MNRSLRVLLFAHDHAGVAALQSLSATGHEIAGCFTHPTHQDWVPSMTDACASLGVPCVDAAPNAAMAQEYREKRPDLILSVGYRRRVPLPFLALPRWGAINASLAPPAALPRRFADPVGHSESGIVLGGDGPRDDPQLQ